MDALAAAARLTARDVELADADARLTELLHDAHRQATAAIRRIEAVRAEIEAVAAGRTVGNAAEGAEVGRFLVAKNREVLAIVEESRALATANAVALQQLTQRYRSSAQR